MNTRTLWSKRDVYKDKRHQQFEIHIFLQEIFSDFYSRLKLHLPLLNQVMFFFYFDHAFFIFFQKNNKTICGSTNLRTHKPKKKSSAERSVPSLIMFHIKGKIFHRGNSRRFTYQLVSAHPD